VTHQTGVDEDGVLRTVRLTPSQPGRQPAFDVTPARLVSAIITERGVCEASVQGLRALYPEAGGRPRAFRFKWNQLNRIRRF